MRLGEVELGPSLAATALHWNIPVAGFLRRCELRSKGGSAWRLEAGPGARPLLLPARSRSAASSAAQPPGHAGWSGGVMPAIAQHAPCAPPAAGVYDRLPHGSGPAKLAALGATFLVSALWHGLQLGFLVAFCGTGEQPGAPSRACEHG